MTITERQREILTEALCSSVMSVAPLTTPEVADVLRTALVKQTQRLNAEIDEANAAAPDKTVGKLVVELAFRVVEEGPALPKLTEAQGEMISHALCSAIHANSPSRLAAIRKALIDECREVNAKVIGF